MTVGHFLDDAALTLRRSQVILRGLTVQDSYGVAAAIVARDYVYRALGRFLAVLRPQEGVRPTPVETAISSLESRDSDPAEKARLLASVIAGATLGAPAVLRDLLRGRQSASEPLMQAADSLGMAAEIIATHLAPEIVPDRASGRITWHRPTLSKQAEALQRGAQRGEILGETARLLLMTAAVDRILATFHVTGQDVLLPQQWEKLELLTNLRHSSALQRLARTAPAHLLRHMTSIEPVESSTGPQTVKSWADVARAISVTRSAVYREGNLATVGLIRATARLGFATTAAALRLSRSSDGRTLAATSGVRWRELASAASAVADTRDAMASLLVRQLGSAQAWIRWRLTNRHAISGAELGTIVDLQRDVGRLCADILDALRWAADRGRLLRHEVAMGDATRGGIVVAVPTWVPARWQSPECVALLRNLRTAAALPALPQPAQRLRDSKVSGDKHAAVDQAASAAWPQTIGQALQHSAKTKPGRQPGIGQTSPAITRPSGSEELER